MRLIKKLARRLDAADEMIQILLNPDPRARVLLGIKRHVEAYGEQTKAGVKVHVRPSELAAEVGTNPTDVDDVLLRLRRLRIVTDDPGGGMLIGDVGRLLEFLEFLEMPKKFEGA
jgi:CRP-like cAMP-binding protein